jgi:hypothetical protein
MRIRNGHIRDHRPPRRQPDQASPPNAPRSPRIRCGDLALPRLAGVHPYGRPLPALRRNPANSTAGSSAISPLQGSVQPWRGRNAPKQVPLLSAVRFRYCRFPSRRHHLLQRRRQGPPPNSRLPGCRRDHPGRVPVLQPVTRGSVRHPEPVARGSASAAARAPPGAAAPPAGTAPLCFVWWKPCLRCRSGRHSGGDRFPEVLRRSLHATHQVRRLPALLHGVGQLRLAA